MTKAVFLEYKFGDYDTQTLYNSGANQVVAWMEKLNSVRLKQLQEWGVKISLCFGACSDELSPLSLKSKKRIKKLIDQVLFLNPHGIILDHLRFPGYWEKDGENKFDSERDKIITELALWTKSLIPRSMEIGYYAIPFKNNLGQNPRLLGNIFDYISPMLYQRMINKPVEYIHQFAEYLFDLTSKPIVPAIAVKDMPDDLLDEIDEKILKEEYLEAAKPSSSGVCWFSWDGAIEKNKTAIISKLFASKI